MCRFSAWIWMVSFKLLTLGSIGGIEESIFMLSSGLSPSASLALIGEKRKSLTVGTSFGLCGEITGWQSTCTLPYGSHDATYPYQVFRGHRISGSRRRSLPFRADRLSA